MAGTCANCGKPVTEFGTYELCGRCAFIRGLPWGVALFVLTALTVFLLA